MGAGGDAGPDTARPAMTRRGLWRRSRPPLPRGPLPKGPELIDAPASRSTLLLGLGPLRRADAVLALVPPVTGDDLVTVMQPQRLPGPSLIASRFSVVMGTQVARVRWLRYDPLAGLSAKDTLEALNRTLPLSEPTLRTLAAALTLAADAHSVDPGGFPAVSSHRLVEILRDATARQQALDALAEVAGIGPDRYELGRRPGEDLSRVVQLLSSLPDRRPDLPRAGVVEIVTPGGDGARDHLYAVTAAHLTRHAHVSVLADAHRWPVELVAQRALDGKGSCIALTDRPDLLGPKAGYERLRLAQECSTLGVGRLEVGTAASAAAALLEARTGKVALAEQVQGLAQDHLLFTSERQRGATACRVSSLGLTSNDRD